MKTIRLALPACLAVLLCFAAFTTAQPPQPAHETPGAEPQKRTYPAPTNLKVLPKQLTGRQVREIMEKWEASLGVHCDTCHTADPSNLAPNGKPRLNFADDSKPEKNTARLMYTMTEEIDQNYISKLDSMENPVTCGTCHRGSRKPLPFVIPEEGEQKAPAPPTPK